MDIIIYAQSLKNDSIGDLFYKDKYINKNENNIDLTKFFKDIKKLNRSEEKDLEKVRSEYNNLNYKYLYLYVPCIEKDDIGRYSPIIIQAYHKDIDKIFEALDEFLERSNRHITEESRKAIEEEIKNFKKERKIGALVAIGAAIGAAIGIALSKNSSKPNSNKETDIEKEENNADNEKGKEKSINDKDEK